MSSTSPATFSADDDPLATGLGWVQSGQRVAMGTVITTWGSSPRPVGSRIAIRDDGVFAGSVSGGCVEAAVIHAALEILAHGGCRTLSFGVDNETAWNAVLSCGGEIRVFVAALDAESTAKEEVARRASRKHFAILTDLGNGRQVLLEQPGPEAIQQLREQHKPDITTPLLADVTQAFNRGVSCCINVSACEFFLHMHTPRRRLLILGAVHIAQHLQHLARQCGYDVYIIDPRAAWANAERFQDIAVIEAWPNEALGNIGIDSDVAVVTLTHDPKLDDVALHLAIQQNAGYIGALGSQRTHAKRAARLQQLGCTAAQIARIHAPVGLNIGARAPADIAVAIMAQIISYFSPEIH